MGNERHTYEGLLERADPAFARNVHRFHVFMLLLNIVFLFGLPYWSYLLNEQLGFVQTLCDTPAEELTCGVDKHPYVGLALELRRIDEDGHLFGCQCDDGILGDWACPINAPNFSVSYFIATAPGTGAMAAINIWPILSMWLFGVARPRSRNRAGGAEAGGLLPADAEHNEAPEERVKRLRWIRMSLFGFQFFYGLFLINTNCVMPAMHKAVVLLFVVAFVVHFTVLAQDFHGSPEQERYIRLLTFGGICALIIGYFYPVDYSWLGQYAFFLGECTALTCAFSITPVLSLHDD